MRKFEKERQAINILIEGLRVKSSRSNGALAQTIKEIRNISGIDTTLECESITLLLPVLESLISIDELFDLSFEWIEQSRNSSDAAGVFALWIIMSVNSSIFDENVDDNAYYIECMIWIHYNNSIFRRGSLAMSNRITSARMFNNIGRAGLCSGVLSHIYDDLSNLNEGEFREVLPAIINNKIFLEEISSDNNNQRLAESGKNLLNLLY